MTLLITPEALERRRTMAGGSLEPLATSLADDLRKVIERPLFVPEEKALLTREGGRCPRDGTMLDFDPFSPREHHCPRCGETYVGALHDRFWIYWYQLWLAERAVHGAVLSRLAVLPDGATFSAAVLDAYSDRYLRYPNVDNTLGPTRVFFSTYLESIWVLQLSIAARLLDRASHGRVIDRFIEHVVEPSVALIEAFDEGASNRQVWNNAAMMAAYLALGRPERAERVVWAKSGVAHHLGSSLLDDGTWYEGENYHLFAHRGLWYAVQLAEAAGFELPSDLVHRYERGFATPFLTSLPDLTFPSRRDSQYAISIRQWRFAEWCELGLARGDDRVLAGMLSRLYTDDIPRGDTGRWKSSAEAERNLPATRLSRADLGWKSLLFARESVALGAARVLPSVLLDAQGIGVIRREQGRVYVALDYGVSGGGHGHPDRLNLTVSDGDRRILDDMGSGSYVHPSLHWYRSTLAHNAPMLDGRSQDRVDGELVAFDDRGAAGWVSGRAAIDFGAMVTRTVVAMPGYLIDEVSWAAPGDHRVFDLPLHFDLVEPDRADLAQVSPGLTGSQGLEDGFRFLRDARRVRSTSPGELVRLQSSVGDLWLAADVELELWTATAPGAPGRGDHRFTILRARASVGTIRWMWSWDASARAAALFPGPSIESGGERHEHLRVEHGWQVAIHVAGARSTIDLGGRVDLDAADAARPVRASPPSVRVYAAGLANHATVERTLAEAHYRRSEQSWREAGSPTARVSITRDGLTIQLAIEVSAERSFVAPQTENRLDNEQADINGAGVQLYLQSGERRAGYVVVPRAESNELSIRAVDGWGAEIPVAGTWHPTPEGYAVDLEFSSAETSFGIDLAINEKPAGRQRRRGQLVLTGADGEWVYLRGDRHDRHRLIFFQLTDD